jgi:hypothetical protein
MNYIAVDFSLNSPGICLYNDKSKKYKFIGYIKPKTGTKKEQALQEELGMLQDVTMVTQPDFTNDENYSGSELAKVKRYDRMADEIINLILQESFPGDSFTIAFEGTSYGSKMGTNNMIDMAAGAAILKLKMLKTLKPDDLLTVAPTTIKKFAGKGNMNKSQVFEAFISNSIDDKSLLKSPFYARVKELDCGKKIPKPVDDLVDAFFLAAMISTSALT